MKTPKGNDGFTLIEVVFSVFIISVGILALLDVAGGSTVMLRDGRVRTRASAVAASRFDNLRLAGAATSPTCTALAGGSANHPGGVAESWSIAGSGRARTVTTLVTVRHGRRTIGQMSFRGSVYCP
jgi:prepilin-type N-terminal cleavage/methylation domain-containing protein